MSGGHYDYAHSRIETLADDIERDFFNDGKFMDKEWDRDAWREVEVERDLLSDATDEERTIILTEIRSLINDLRIVAKRAKDLDWFLSGDTGAKSYIEDINECAPKP